MENIRRTKAYLVNLSKGEPVQIDEEELAKVVQALQAGSIAILKQGIINPSYVISITPDTQRIREWLEDVNKYNDEEKRKNGIAPLKELISRSEIVQLLEANQPKRLK